MQTDEKSARVVIKVADVVRDLENYTEVTLAEAIYAAAQDNEMDPKELFKLIYTILIGKEKGPRLAGFIITAGKEKILPLLEKGFVISATE